MREGAHRAQTGVPWKAVWSDLELGCVPRGTPGRRKGQAGGGHEPGWFACGFLRLTEAVSSRGTGPRLSATPTPEALAHSWGPASIWEASDLSRDCTMNGVSLASGSR